MGARSQMKFTADQCTTGAKDWIHSPDNEALIC